MKVGMKNIFEFEMSEKEARLLSSTLKKINGILVACPLKDDEQMLIDELIDNIDYIK